MGTAIAATSLGRGGNLGPAGWSPWALFPDPRQGGILIAPFGPGCYELRIAEQLLLFECGQNVAERMSSLLPKPWGAGRRNNKRKRQAVFDNLGAVEYRTLACDSRAAAAAEETKMRARRGEYLFGA
jgi:hypothetical protein